jgi:hypothetical protein
MKYGFHVDLHTSHSPIIACGCTRLQDLFCIRTDTQAPTSTVLYVVNRKVESDEAAPKRGTISRDRTYLLDQAWQPSVPQTTRGMAALLSSLYRLTQSVPLKGVSAEGRVLSMLHKITSFPPAVRARECPLSLHVCLSSSSLSSLVGILFLNRDARSEERAALSEALYHTLKDFLSGSTRGPSSIITDPTRLFEAASLLSFLVEPHSL